LPPRASHPPPLPVPHSQADASHTEEDKPRINAPRVRQQPQPNVDSSNTGVLLVPPQRHPARKAKNAAKHPDAEKSANPANLTAFVDHAQEMHRLLTHATNADECRLIVDMFLVKSGLQLESANNNTPYPSPPLEPAVNLPSIAEAELENSLVELFLGGAGDADDSEVEDEDDEEPLSPTDTVVSKDAPLTLPHDTPFTTRDNITTTQKVVTDAQEVI
jgi:hypothetical protein